MPMTYQAVSHISQAQDEVLHNSEMGRATLPALGLGSEWSEKVDQIQGTQKHNDFANAWGQSTPSPAHPQAQRQYPRGTRPIWPSVLIPPEDLFEPSIPLKNDYDRTPWDRPYWPKSKASLPRTVQRANERIQPTQSASPGLSAEATSIHQVGLKNSLNLKDQASSSGERKASGVKGVVKILQRQSLLSEDLHNSKETQLPSQKPRGPVHESFQRKSPVISEETDPIHPEETSEETSSARSKTKSIQNEPGKGSRENRPDPRITESKFVQEGSSSSGSNTWSPLNQSKKKDRKPISSKNSSGKVAPLTPEQLLALEKKGKWKVLSGSAEKSKKPSEVKEYYFMGKEAQAVSETLKSTESFPMSHSEPPLPPNTAHHQQKQGFEKTYKNTLNKIKLDEMSQKEDDSISAEGKGVAFVTKTEGETIKPSEQKNKESKIGISSESSDNGPTEEDIHILSLIDQVIKNTPEPQKIISTAPMRFKINYDSQANYLFSEYQKAKESSTSKNPNRSLLPIMAPLTIEPQMKKKIARKIELVFQDKKFILRSPPLESRSLKQYSEVTVQKFFELWGQGYVLSWEANRLDIKLMSQLAVILNLHNDSPHFGISPIFHKVDIHETFQLLERQKLSKVLGLIYEKLGKEEGTRRLEAFTKFLMYHSIAKRWKALKRGWKKDGKRSSIQAEFFEIVNGISEDPQFIVEIPQRPSLWTSVGSEMGPKSTWPTVEKIYGIQYAKIHSHFLDYTEGMLPDIQKWWKSTGLESASRKYGLDILRILKVGEVLQFGSDHFVLNFGNRETSAEKAFSRILDIMNEPRSLPWIESPERAWLYSAVGSLYQDRLRDLSLHIFFKGYSSKQNMELTRSTRSGFELLWCDLGLNLMDAPQISDLQDPANFQKKLKRYQNISGCFSEYSRMAISICFRFFYANHQIHLSKAEERYKKLREFLHYAKNIFKEKKEQFTFFIPELPNFYHLCRRFF
ncbi:hypothetical protein VP01_2341g2 [Puccinia sorghi]|uniref:Uncharacterized protein n=1 Tax=Puccinia sorghi TaxID=27349 RepID=A0A0L6V988_9BASI|nr:hypothetical protein VP01_2341g2 [Puccinia sorghi]